MKSKFIKGIVSAALLGGAVFSYAGPGIADGAAKFIGNITQSGTAPGPNDQFTQLWNQATAENGCKWGSVEGTRGRYNWGACDAAYNWAKNNGGHFKFHALVWGSQYPGWLNGLSVDETKKAITAWFDAVIRMAVTTQFFDIDYLNFVAGKDTPNPGGSGNENGNENPPGPGSDAIQTSIHMETPVLGDYYVFDVNGVRIGRLSAYTMDEAVTTLKNSSAIKVQGVYLLRSVKNGAVKSVRVAR